MVDLLDRNVKSRPMKARTEHRVSFDGLHPGTPQGCLAHWNSGFDDNLLDVHALAAAGERVVQHALLHRGEFVAIGSQRNRAPAHAATLPFEQPLRIGISITRASRPDACAAAEQSEFALVSASQPV